MEPVMVDYCDDYEDALGLIVDREWLIHEYGAGWAAACRWLVRFWSSSQVLRKAVLSGGEVIGAVFATVEPGPEEIDLDGLRMISSRQMSEDLGSMISADREMISGLDLGGYGRLDLLILSETAKGAGIGKMMYEHAAQFLRGRGCRGMYWVTDSDCNTGFYEHIGAERLAERHIELSSEELDRFIYGLRFRCRRPRFPTGMHFVRAPRNGGSRYTIIITTHPSGRRCPNGK